MKLKLLLLLTIISQSLLSQTYIVNDTFDSDALGTLPNGWVIKFNGTGDANQKVVNTTSVSPNNSFEIEGLSGGNDANLYKTPSTLPNEISIEAYVKTEIILPNYTGSFGLSRVAGDYWGTSCMRLMFKNGKLVANYRGGNDYEIQDYTINQWYHIKLEANLTDKLFQVYIDGIQVSGTYGSNTVTNFPMHPSVTPAVIMLATGDQSNKMWFDDVKLYETPNLIAYYPFNGNANDESVNLNHGTVNGATLTTDRFGVANSAYSFNGLDNYISITDNPKINIQTGESYSISFWLQHASQNNGKYMISKYNGSIGVEPSYGLGTGSYGDSYSWFEFTAGNGIENRGDIDLNDNEWHQITSVFKSGESVSIYVDGILDIQHPTTHVGSISNTRDLTIGCGANIARFYNGKIDDIKIYNKALTVEEIQNEVTELVVHYPFNGNANDESGNENHGTVNGATLTTDRFGDPNTAYNFDGNDIITIAHNDLLNSSDELSISVWVNPNSLQDAMILGKSNYMTNTNYLLRTKSTGYLAFEYKDFANSSSLPLTAGIWNHIAVISNTDNSKMVYINGVLATHTTASSPFGLVTNALTIGARSFDGGEGFQGAIDDLSIYKSSLTEAEVLNLYNNNTLDISEAQFDQKISFYVNSNNLYFNKDQNLSEIKYIAVYNLLGQNVFQDESIQNEVSLNFLKQGIYILRVEDNNRNTTTKKFVIH